MSLHVEVCMGGVFPVSVSGWFFGTDPPWLVEQR